MNAQLKAMWDKWTAGEKAVSLFWFAFAFALPSFDWRNSLNEQGAAPVR